MSKSSGTGGFLVLAGSMVAIVGCFIPFGSLIPPVYDVLSLLFNFSRFMGNTEALLNNILLVLIFLLPLATLLITTTPIVTKQFDKVKLLSIILSAGTLVVTLIVGFQPLLNTFSGGLLESANVVSTGFWVILAGSAVGVVGGLDLF